MAMNEYTEEMDSEDDVYLPFHTLPSETRRVRKTWYCLWGPNPDSYAVLITLIITSCSILSATM
ncbi:hypothetical protein BEWA_031030 [Theileria equi strain WA]|uniref:Uncharacterized protein n=1 Tax=Theileria equi strain WA TaxID=1537102 RepID=L0AXF5_THEEQ|nr:hypothetical protein BEWA_031030 [Theileria equi strain WA]AFZ80250.1 hypothetical protein BEWA_031030 [Theileria equi strain WA]|eukprot:XP_004829916.1 hypothetical protein BEWA_031030 [Theileria equi strain WA]